MKEDRLRWPEIKFVILIKNLIDIANDYVIAMQYIDMLCSIIGVTSSKGRKLAQTAMLTNPTQIHKTEEIYYARKNGMSIAKICKYLHISKTTYMKKIQEPVRFSARQYSDEDVKMIILLLRAEHKLRKAIEQ